MLNIDVKKIQNKKIVIFTLNPAIDKRWIVKNICVNKVSRILETTDSAGGKGMNECRVINTFETPVIASGIVAGYNGEYLINLLNKEGIKHDFYKLNSEQTRICVNINGIQEHSQTELLEPGPHLTRKDVDGFIKHFKKVINNADIVSIAGGIPKGMPANIYSTLIQICKQQKIKVFVDTSGETLKMALNAKPYFVKPNVDEIAQLLNKDKYSIHQAIMFAKEQVQQGVDNFVLSLGSKGAILITKSGIYHAVPPKHKVVNTVGCGDTLVASFIIADLLNFVDKEKIQFATAVAAAASTTKGTAEVYLKDVVKFRLLTQIN